MQNSIKFFVSFLSTGFFIGLVPYASGTLGSLFGVTLCYAFFGLVNFCLYQILLINVFIFVIGTFLCYKYQNITKKHDAKEVVIDEIGAVFFILSTVKIIYAKLVLVDYVLVFLIFRFFDILKPLGISKIDKNINNGLGVMLDDYIAAVYSLTIIVLIKHLFPDINLLLEP